MKTLKEILENFHDSALTRLTEEEINLESLKNRAKKTKPGVDYDKLQESITIKEKKVEIISSVVKIIDKRLVTQPDQDVGEGIK